MPSGQMVSIEVWSNPNWIQQWDKPSSRWKRECVLRSEARHGQAGGLKFQLFFVFWFVCVFFAVSRSCLKQMKVLEERLMYLFIVFCKDLLCIPFHFGSRTFICAFTIFCFPPSLTLFSCFHMGLVDLLISVFHLAFTRFESYGAPISGLLVLAYMCYQTMAFLFSRYRWLHFLLRCASSSMRWWLLCQSWHSAEPATIHAGALNTFFLFSSVAADFALRLGPDIGRSG